MSLKLAQLLTDSRTCSLFTNNDYELLFMNRVARSCFLIYYAKQQVGYEKGRPRREPESPSRSTENYTTQGSGKPCGIGHFALFSLPITTDGIGSEV